jgi:hydrogenase maturation factor
MSFELPGRIVDEYTIRNNRLGLVQFDDTSRPIFLDLVPDAHIGDYVRVHVGFAVERVGLDEVRRAYQKHEKSPPAELELEQEEALPEMARRQKQR